MNEHTLSNGISVPYMLFGSFQMKGPDTMSDVVHSAVESGVTGFDTSPSYHTERAVADAIRRETANGRMSLGDFWVQSKIDIWQMIVYKGAVRDCALEYMERAGIAYWDTLLIHWPQPDYLIPTWKAMETLYREKRVRSIGVCNFTLRHFKRLMDSDITMLPHICQNEIHPLNTEPELSAFCKEHGILLEAYSPLCRMLPAVKDDPVIRSLAASYGVSPAQLMLRWHIEHGRVPIVKTDNPARARENANVLSFSLLPEDTEKIDALDRRFKIFLGSRCCPGY
jgi:diketogulonate reductase-like aldo/keto reductase